MRSTKITAFMFILLSLIVLPCCIAVENTDDPDKSVHDTVMPTEKPFIFVKSGGKYVAPRVNFINSRKWFGSEWLCSDGLSVIYFLSDIADDLPVISYDDDFTVKYGDNISFPSLSVYYTGFYRIKHNTELSYLEELSEGTYYISITVSEKASYIEEENGYECMYRLDVK